MNHLRRFASLFAITLLLAVACSPAAQEPPDEPAASANPEIECQVYYRASAGQALIQGPEMLFSGQNEQASAPFDDLEFQARDYSDQGEGRSLSITVLDLDSGDEIMQQLFQLDPQGLRNQFIGGHGFTGLIYLFHPVSSAEMQYFCFVR